VCRRHALAVSVFYRWRAVAQGGSAVALKRDAQRTPLRGLTIFDVLISMLFEVRFPFRFPHAVGESGKRNWEVSWRGGVVEQFAESRGIRFG